MPFCTACGRQNPDDARFCSQCGTRLVQPDAPAGGSEGAGAAQQTGGQPAVGEQSTATVTFGALDKSDTSDRQLDPVDAAAVDALPLGSALLVVQRGPGAGSRFLLDEDTTSAGRHPDSAIFLDDVTVSRRHAEFRREEGRFVVTDAGSLNGTYVNRDRIDRVQLKDGDEVQIGKYRLVFFAGHAG